MLRNGRDWFRPGSFGAQLLEKTRDFVAQVDLVDAFLKRLDRDGWHFVLHQLDLRSLVRLARLEHDAAVVQALLLDTLDLVLREDEEFVAAIKQSSTKFRT